MRNCVLLRLLVLSLSLSGPDRASLYRENLESSEGSVWSLMRAD
jgi:hypothetical protein